MERKEEPMAKLALIRVDVQNDFCPGGSLAVTEGDQVVAPLDRMKEWIKREGGIVFDSRDWHVPQMEDHFRTWPVHCVANTVGAEFHRNLDTEGDLIVSKGMDPEYDGYSACDGVVEGRGLKLVPYLQSRGVETIYVGGLATDYCVKHSAIDLVKAGFRVVLLVDAIRAVNFNNPNAGALAIRDMKDAGVELTTTDEVING